MADPAVGVDVLENVLAALTVEEREDVGEGVWDGEGLPPLPAAAPEDRVPEGEWVGEAVEVWLALFASEVVTVGVSLGVEVPRGGLCVALKEEKGEGSDCVAVVLRETEIVGENVVEIVGGSVGRVLVGLMEVDIDREPSRGEGVWVEVRKVEDDPVGVIDHENAH